MSGSGHDPEAGKQRPLVSVLTASYQQAEFLEACIRSVPSDEGDDVEQVVVDGGSTDGTVELLERMSRGRRLRWVSEPDEGQADAYNKALTLAAGTWVGLQNSDDYYLDGAFEGLRRAIDRAPGRDAHYGNVLRVDDNGQVLRRVWASRPSWFVHRFRGLTIRHQALFVRRETLEAVGGLDPSFHLALDYELIARLLRSPARLCHVPEFWGAFRVQEAAKSEHATEEAWRSDIEAALGGVRYPAGRWSRPLLRGAAAALQWTHIVADNGPRTMVSRAREKWWPRRPEAVAEPGSTNASRPGRT